MPPPARHRGQPPPPARRRGRPPPDPARRAAYDLLRAVDEHAGYANLVLPRLLTDRRLDPRDAAFATELGYGALRAQGTLDVVLAACLDRPLDAIQPAVRDLLRLGGYQLLRTRTPVHAAVSATVDLAREVAGEGPASLVNAVLRRVAGRDLAGWLAELAPPYELDPVGYLALTTSHPGWVVEAFRDALGGDLAETGAALAADDGRPSVHLVARPGRVSREALLISAEAAGRRGPWSPYAVRLEGGNPGRLAEVRDGRAAVQDEGSQLAALVLAAADLDGPDRWWLDACAGPGGKAGLLAGVAADRGARLLAVDRAPHRAHLVRATLAGGPDGTAAADLIAAVVVADSTAPAWPTGRFDRVLVDAPCSGLGALRRRPEVRWRRSPADVAGLFRLQCALLAAALESARPGGMVAYVTCSPHLAETRGVLDATLRGRPEVERVDVRSLLAGVPHLGDGPEVQLWPHRHGTDAMFIALLRATGRP